MRLRRFASSPKKAPAVKSCGAVLIADYIRFAETKNDQSHPLSSQYLRHYKSAAKELGFACHVVEPLTEGHYLDAFEAATSALAVGSGGEAIGIIVGHRSPNAVVRLARLLEHKPNIRGFVNAGDGVHSSIASALACAFAVINHSRDYAKLTVLLLGDIAHNPIGRDLVAILVRLGVKVHLWGPRALLGTFESSRFITEHFASHLSIHPDVVVLVPFTFDCVREGIIPSWRDFVADFPLAGLGKGGAMPSYLSCSTPLSREVFAIDSYEKKHRVYFPLRDPALLSATHTAVLAQACQ